MVRVEREGDGSARVVSDPPGLDCDIPCEGFFDAGTTVTMRAEPGYRSEIEGWDLCGASVLCTVVVNGDLRVTARVTRAEGVRLSETDRDPALILRDDWLAVDFAESGGVRSRESIAPGSGVHYFEAHRLVEPRVAFGFGVATADAPLTQTSIGQTDQSFGLTADGSVFHAGRWITRLERGDRYGFVVDYRGEAPLVYVLTATGRVFESELLSAIRSPLYVYLVGSKSAPTWHVEINPGNDTTVAPFAFDARAMLNAAGYADVAEALLEGWGATFAGPPDDPPHLSVPPDLEVTAGTPVTLRASATDAEDGDLGDAITWELLSSPHYAGRIRGSGETFTFTPTAVGLHPARASVRDEAEHRVEATVMVRVRGPVREQTRVMLVQDALSGSGIEIAPDGRAARWTARGKNGVRANQGLYGEFWYFEIRRLVEPINQGGGLVIAAGNLNPYTLLDVPPSCSINTFDGVYQDLIWHSNFPMPVASYEHYGFAVDYRGMHPVVYIIAGNVVVDELVLEDAWVEVFPMLYGNPTGLSGAGEYDEGINFGAAPFAYDASAILSAHGVDTSELEVRWGNGT